MLIKTGSGKPAPFLTLIWHRVDRCVIMTLRIFLLELIKLKDCSRPINNWNFK